MNTIFSASWIKPARQRKNTVINFKKSFTVKPFPVRALLHITSLGVYNCEINGKSVTSSVLNPGWTDYNKRIQYQTYDVTDMIMTAEMWKHIRTEKKYEKIEWSL